MAESNKKPIKIISGQGYRLPPTNLFELAYTTFVAVVLSGLIGIIVACLAQLIPENCCGIAGELVASSVGDAVRDAVIGATSSAITLVVIINYVQADVARAAYQGAQSGVTNGPVLVNLRGELTRLNQDMDPLPYFTSRFATWFEPGECIKEGAPPPTLQGILPRLSTQAVGAQQIQSVAILLQQGKSYSAQDYINMWAYIDRTYPGRLKHVIVVRPSDGKIVAAAQADVQAPLTALLGDRGLALVDNFLKTALVSLDHELGLRMYGFASGEATYNSNVQSFFDLFVKERSSRCIVEPSKGGPPGIINLWQVLTIALGRTAPETKA